MVIGISVMDTALRMTRHSVPLQPIWIILTFAFTIFSCTPARYFACAQSQPTYHNPISTYFSAFARTSSKLYIAGGNAVLNSSLWGMSQFVSLDLTVSWNTTAPAWTKLADGPPLANFPGTFSSDEKTMFTFHISGTNSPWEYSVEYNTWKESTIKFENSAFAGIRAVTDPSTGFIYLAGGFKEANYNASYLKFLEIFNPASQSIQAFNLPDPATAFPIRRFYGSVWSNYLNGIIYWGGANDNDNDWDNYPTVGKEQYVVTQLSTDTLNWSTMRTKGAAPEPRTQHCMAANEDGTKVAIYGGRLAYENFIGEVWVLDVPTATWSRGQSGPTRQHSACTIAGDQFLVWGGMKNGTIPDPVQMLVYNLTSSKYAAQYTPPASYKNLKPPPRATPVDVTQENRDVGHSPVPLGAAIGGAIASLVLLGVVVGTLVIRRRRHQDQSQKQNVLKNDIVPNGLSWFLRRGQDGGSNESAKKDPQEINEDDELERTLQELQDREKELEDREKEIFQKRQLLVQQHLDSNPSGPTDRKRGPAAFAGDKAEVALFPIPPICLSPDVVLPATSFSPENLNDRRTVQAVYGVAPGDGESKREGEMAQDTIEPIYGPSPEVNSAIPDLIYIPPPNVGMDWIKQQQENHPHTIVDASLQSEHND